MPERGHVILGVVGQHLGDAAALRATRATLVRAPQLGLLQLGRADERLLAHLDGLSVAGDEGYRLAQAGLEAPEVGSVFVAAVLAIERRDMAQIEDLLGLVDTVPDAGRGLASAFGWVPAASLRGLTAPLLGAPGGVQRWLGMAACAAHRVDPGPALPAALAQGPPPVRSAALRAAGLVGRVDLLPLALHHLGDEDPACRHAAATAAVLLGERDAGLSALQTWALSQPASDLHALQLALLSATPADARRLVRQLAEQGAPQRTTLRAAAWAGDIQAAPWLIQQMADERHARLAGEAFSFLSGADLAGLELERPAPADFEGGPSEDPADDETGLDEDEGLPWPDPVRVQAWWQAQGGRIPQGVRVLAGAAADAAQCAHVLTHAGQRLRHAAALLLTLAQPGRALFNVAAPAARQRRLLGAPQRRPGG